MRRHLQAGDGLRPAISSLRAAEQTQGAALVLGGAVRRTAAGLEVRPDGRCRRYPAVVGVDPPQDEERVEMGGRPAHPRPFAARGDHHGMATLHAPRANRLNGLPKVGIANLVNPVVEVGHLAGQGGGGVGVRGGAGRGGMGAMRQAAVQLGQ